MKRKPLALENEKSKESEQKGHQSVSPGLITGIAAHESSHGLIRGPGLFHVLTKGLFRMTKATLLAGVLVDGFLHGIVEAGLVFLQLRHLILPNDLFGLLVEVGLLVVLGQLTRSYLARQHPRLRLAGAGAIQTATDRVDTLEERFFGLVAKDVPQLFETVMQENHSLRGPRALIKTTHKTAIQRLQYAHVCPFVISQQILRISDGLDRFFLLFGLTGLLLLCFLQALHFFLEGNHQFEPFDVHFSLLGLCDFFVKICQSARDEVELFLGRALEDVQLLQSLRDGFGLFAAPLLEEQQVGFDFTHDYDNRLKWRAQSNLLIQVDCNSDMKTYHLGSQDMCQK